MPFLYIPVELGETLYMVNTVCCGICYKSDCYNRGIPEEKIGCKPEALCQTRFMDPISFKLTLDNLPGVLEKWDVEIFSSEQKAIDRTIEVISEHTAELKKYGFKFNEDGTLKDS